MWFQQKTTAEDELVHWHSLLLFPEIYVNISQVGFLSKKIADICKYASIYFIFADLYWVVYSFKIIHSIHKFSNILICWVNEQIVIKSMGGRSVSEFKVPAATNSLQTVMIFSYRPTVKVNMKII